MLKVLQILRKLIVIKRKLVMLEYNEAQAEYFSLTIGNAPWPTMLGSKSTHSSNYLTEYSTNSW